MLKHCAANRKRRISALPSVSPYIYDVKISGIKRSSTHIYDISRLRVNRLEKIARDRDAWKLTLKGARVLHGPCIQRRRG
jgi:hypothetical protein